jgi:hypothetical protein
MTILTMGKETFPRRERNIPTLGMRHSQRGNVSFPGWEHSLSHSVNRLYPLMFVAYAPNVDGLLPLMRIG